MSTTDQRTSSRPPARRGALVGDRPARGIGARLGDLLLTIASIGGVVCILAVLAALLFKVSLIMFSTGSMAPTIPTGSVAVVREIPAAQVVVGDVVTVDRPGQLPVTHRVRAVEPGPGDVRVLTLRGDANEQDDAVTYPVDTVRLVLFSVPKLAAVIVSLSDPFVLGGITVVMAALVMWAFWPRRRGEDPPGDGTAEDGSPAEPEGGRHRAVTTTGLVALALLAASGLTLGGPPAHAATVERVIEGSVLRLTTIGDDTAMTQMRPGVPVVWQVGVTTSTAEPGIVDLAMRVSGPLAADDAGLQLRLSVCDVRWEADRCSVGEQLLIGPGPAARYANRSYALDAMPTDQQRWVLVTAWLPTGSTVQGRSAAVTVAAHGIGETVAAQPGVPGPVPPLPEPTMPLPGAPLPGPDAPLPGASDPLPDTGVGTSVRTALFAGLLTLAVGSVLMAATRRRRRESACGG